MKNMARKPEPKAQREHRLACVVLDHVDFSDLLAGLDALEAERGSKTSRAMVAATILQAVEALPVTLAGVVEFRQAIADVAAHGGPLDEGRRALMVLMSASSGRSAAQAQQARHADASAKGGMAVKKLDAGKRKAMREFYKKAEAEHRELGLTRGWVKATAREFGVSVNTVREVVSREG